MKRLVLTIAIILGVFIARAETVSQKQAQQMAQLFFNEASGRVTPPPKMVFNGKKLTTGRLFTPFYVYNSSTGAFVIISAENKAFPILGFSLKSSFDPNSIGETETALLKLYAREIELIRYDSTTVEEAEKAWINYPSYINDILQSRYVATDPIISTEEAFRIVDLAEDKGEAVYSDIYTPQQWQDMILEELAAKQSVPLILYNGSADFPAVVYGHQGGYFRIEMTRRNDWLMRLNATETISSTMVSAVNYLVDNGEFLSEETPFEELNYFLEELELQELNRASESSIDRIDSQNNPVLLPLGSGHYQITLPENAVSSSVYNLSGALITHQKFANTSIVNIDIAAEPRGFYFLTVRGESGTPYGFKLYR